MRMTMEKSLYERRMTFCQPCVLPKRFFAALTHCRLNKRRKKLLKIMVKCSSVNARSKSTYDICRRKTFTHFIFFCVCVIFFSHEFHVTIVLQFDFIQCQRVVMRAVHQKNRKYFFLQTTSSKNFYYIF